MSVLSRPLFRQMDAPRSPFTDMAPAPPPMAPPPREWTQMARQAGFEQAEMEARAGEQQGRICAEDDAGH